MNVLEYESYTYSSAQRQAAERLRLRLLNTCCSTLVCSSGHVVRAAHQASRWFENALPTIAIVVLLPSTCVPVFDVVIGLIFYHGVVLEY